MATAVEEHLDCYFSSLNSMTRTIWQDKQSLQQSLNGKELNGKEQEKLFRKHFVDSIVQQKYSHAAKEETPSVFPKLKVNCGEKIVVDFENDDGWTWRDEHSGPFSWMTRSQQDLTLDELDDLGEQTNKKQKARRISQSLDCESTTSRKPREASFINHEKTNTEAAHTADEIFQKFGIAFSFGKDEEPTDRNDCSLSKDVASLSAESKLSGEENENFILDEDGDGIMENGSMLYDSFRDTIITDSSEVGSFDNRKSNLNITAESMENFIQNGRLRSDSNQSETEVALMSGDHLERDLDSCQGVSQSDISPVFIEERGESSTDPRQSCIMEPVPESPSVLDPCQSMGSSNIILEQPTRTFNIEDLSNASTIPDSKYQGGCDPGCAGSSTNQTDDANPMTKSGFDFLDNW